MKFQAQFHDLSAPRTRIRPRTPLRGFVLIAFTAFNLWLWSTEFVALQGAEVRMPAAALAPLPTETTAAAAQGISPGAPAGAAAMQAITPPVAPPAAPLTAAVAAAAAADRLSPPQHGTAAAAALAAAASAAVAPSATPAAPWIEHSSRIARRANGKSQGVVHYRHAKGVAASVLIAEAKAEARKRDDVVAFAVNSAWGIQYYGRDAFPLTSAGGWTAFTLNTPGIEELVHPFGIGVHFAASIPKTCPKKVLFMHTAYGQMNNNLLSIRAAWAIASRVGRTVVVASLVRGGRTRHYWNMSRHCIVDSDQWDQATAGQRGVDVTKAMVGGGSAPSPLSSAIAAFSSTAVQNAQFASITMEQLYYTCLTQEVKRDWYASILKPTDELAAEVLQIQNAHLGGRGAYTALHWRADGGGFDCTRRATKHYTPPRRPGVLATCAMALSTIDSIVAARQTADAPFFLATNRADSSQFAKCVFRCCARSTSSHHSPSSLTRSAARTRRAGTILIATPGRAREWVTGRRSWTCCSCAERKYRSATRRARSITTCI